MSRNCDEALANLYAYLDAELDEVSAEEIRAHLAECGGCDRPFDFERRLRAGIRAKRDEEVPQELIGRIKTVISVEARGGGSPPARAGFACEIMRRARPPRATAGLSA